MVKTRKFILLKVALLLYCLTFIFRRDIFNSAIVITWEFLKEMLQVLPPVLVISALITVWVPAHFVQKGLGEGSGVKGKLMSLIIGSLSAGPIYAAFPATLVLFKKGASISNIIIILSSWAVIKIPMLFVEMNFLGLRFTVIRFILTLPVILFMGYLMERLIKREDIKTESPKDMALPNLNCGACGYEDCLALKLAIKDGHETIDKCLVLNRK